MFNYKYFDDLSIELIDGDRGKNYPKNDEMLEKGYCLFLNAKNVTLNGFVFDENVFITKEKDEILRKGKLNRNDIVLTTRGTIGNVGLYDDKITYDNVRINSGMLIIRNNDNNINTKYLYYQLTSPFIRNQIFSLKTGSAQPQIPITVLKKLKLIIPDKRIQDKIVRVMDSIINKLTLNNEINNNLHDLCNNLYFKLVSQLNDTNSSVESIKNVAKCVLGGTPSRTKKEYWNGSINWINSGEINKFRIIKASEKITELGLNKSSTTLLPRGTTVLAITGATLGQVSRLEIDSCANQSVIGIITNKKELNNYMYLSILNSINDLVLKQTGGAQQHINKNDVETHEIIVPSTELISQFDEIIRPLFDQISVNCFEINKLEQLRDTLLPKLMNGEIDLDNIEI